jgi:hypothetical protein
MPACVTVTDCPPTVTVADRDEVLVLAVTVSPTVPLPVPLAPDEIDNHDAVSVAVQPQPVPAVTLRLIEPPADVELADVGDTLYVHGAEKENVFDAALAVEPPGPTADTVAV